MSETDRPDKHDWMIVDIGDNDEFLSWATIVYIVNGKETKRDKIYSTYEFPPDDSAEEIARSQAIAWKETMDYTIEERLGPYGLEWQREQEERYGRQ